MSFTPVVHYNGLLLYRERFVAPYPARTTLTCSLVAIRFEMEYIAAAGGGGNDSAADGKGVSGSEDRNA